MTMQRRHFELIADVLRDTLDFYGEEATFKAPVETVALRMATRLASTNPNFDRARFLRACGVES